MQLSWQHRYNATVGVEVLPTFETKRCSSRQNIKTHLHKTKKVAHTCVQVN